MSKRSAVIMIALACLMPIVGMLAYHFFFEAWGGGYGWGLGAAVVLSMIALAAPSINRLDQ